VKRAAKPASDRHQRAPFLFAPFLWASKEKGPACAADRALLNNLAAEGGTMDYCLMTKGSMWS
jgi:hypothetical protein